VCSRVSVPLDWSGQRPDRLSLAVEMRRDKGPARGVIFLMAGGPGQASTRYFDIGEYGYWSVLFRDYTLVTFDPRGTGDSNQLSCRSAASDIEGSRAARIGADCARQLGSRRAFFATSDNVKDIEAIRRALGFPRIGLYGASYGTDLALAYTRSFPDRVQRLVLDSVASPWSALPVLSEILRQVPATLRAFCAGVCSGVTSDYPGEVIALANSLAAKPLRGRVRQSDGGSRAERLDALRFLGLVIETDLNPGLAAELPAAVHAARQGEARPLLRLSELIDGSRHGERFDAVYAATSCDDGPFPWQSDTPVAHRPALFKNALAQVPKGSLGGFGSWAVAGIGNASLCLEWPPSPVRELRPAATYPDVPVLAVSGALDLRSPTLEARALLTHFPHGQLVTVSNGGHAALASSFSACLVEAVRSWVGGRRAPRSCHGSRLLAPLAALPHERRPATAAATLALVTKTIQEAEAAWLMASYEGGPDAIPGVAAGRLAVTDRGFTLSGYSLAAGLSLNGALQGELSNGFGPLRAHGIIRVKQGAATIGSVAVNGDTLDGRLEGRTVVAGRLAAAGTSGSVGGAGQAWSTWTPPAGSTAELATAIGSRVAGEYRLDAAGTQLLAVRTGPPTSPSDSKRAISALAVQRSPYSSSSAQFHLTRHTWTYTLCGAGARCSLGGQPSTTRGRLVRREALEVALYTFKFAPQLSSLLVYLPPAPGEAPTTVLYFERGRLAAQLSQPLDKTLTLASPPLPSDPDASEVQTIDSLTLPYMYRYAVAKLEGGGTKLELTPSE